ncbi:MAG: hypothetical protein GY788_32825 [bacterium]|nr:hypothetical protein [bacterium]
MRLHRAGEIKYVETDWERRTQYGFAAEPTARALKANSLIAIEAGGVHRRCVVESNDSFYVMSHLVRHTDVYFCAGYNTTFFRERQLPPILSWQTDADVEQYARKGRELIAEYGDHFDRVAPFIPIAPNMHRQSPISALRQKVRNVRHRATRLLGHAHDWSGNHGDFEDRYAYLLSLRNQPTHYDVVLLDTLWGWPRHRLALHERLASLAAQGRIVHSRLAWQEPSPWDGSETNPFEKERFPIVLGAEIDGYEPMLAHSRLAPLATGFHFGWRNIMTLGLMIGVPIMTDRIILEPWFGIDRFQIEWNEEDDWNGLLQVLDRTTDELRTRIANHNTAAFDEFMTPERTARYVIDTALSDQPVPL